MKQAAVGAGEVLTLALASAPSPGVDLGARGLRREWNRTLLAEGFRRENAEWGQRSRAFAYRKLADAQKQKSACRREQ